MTKSNKEVLSESRGKVSAAVFRPQPDKKGYFREQMHRLKKHRNIFWFILPAAFLAIMFGYIPMAGALIAFRSKFNYLGTHSLVKAFLGGEWSVSAFTELFVDSDGLFWTSVKNTLVVNIVKIILTFPIPILLAVLLVDISRPGVSKTILIVLCLPHFLSWAMAIGIWKNLLSPDSGALNNILINIGILKEPYYFFGSNGWFKPLVVFLAAWKGSGWNTIIFFAAVVAIDKSFFEAATLEGANKFQKIRFVTIPTILPTIALMLVNSLTYLFTAGLEQFMAMYESPTRYSQYVIDTLMYDKTMQSAGNYPVATALGLMNGVIALVLMLGGNAFVKKKLHTSLW